MINCLLCTLACALFFLGTGSDYSGLLLVPFLFGESKVEGKSEARKKIKKLPEGLPSMFVKERKNHVINGENGGKVKGKEESARASNLHLMGVTPQKKRRKGDKVVMGGLAYFLPIFIIAGLLLGSAFAVYNSDSIYLAGKTSSTVIIPDELIVDDGSTIFVTTNNMAGKGVAKDVSITVESSNQTYRVYQGRTSSDGTLWPNLDLPDINGTAVMIVETEDDRISRPITLTRSSSKSVKLLITTDKPLYQPGQVIHLRVLALGAKGAVKDNLLLELQTPEGDTVLKKELRTNEYGVASMDYHLADIMPLGSYSVKTSMGEASSEKTILVKEYVLPRFDISWGGLKGWYTVDETVEGNITCDYFFGKNVQGTAYLQARVYVGTWSTVYTNYFQLSDGKAEFTIPATQYAVGLPSNKDNGLLELNLTITDTGGHSESKTKLLSIARAPIMITGLADTNVLGAESLYYIIAQTPDGLPVANATAEFLLDDGTSLSGSTDERGIAVFQFTYSGQDEVRITVAKDDLFGNETFPMYGGDGLKVIPEKGLYSLGEEAVLDVFYSGDALSSYVYYEAISQGRTINTGRIKLKDGHGSFALSISPDFIETTSIRVYKVEGQDVLRDTVVIGISPSTALFVNITKDQVIYTPGQAVSLGFLVQNLDGPVQAALGIAIVDQSIFEMAERFGGLEELYFALEAEYQEPTYMMADYVFGTGTSLPVTEEKVLDMDDREELVVVNTYESRLDEAQEFMESKVSDFWVVVAFIAFIGMGSIMVLGLIYMFKLTITFIVILLVFLVPMAMLNMMTTEMASTSDLDGPGDGGQDDMFGGDVPEGDFIQVPGMMEDRMIFAADANAPGKMLGAGNESGGLAEPSRTRLYFPETWYWNPMLITDENGYASLDLIAPDSLTSWQVKAVASTKDGDVGVGTANVTVFQEFFVEPDIPVSVVRHDEFPLHVQIFNYGDSARTVEVELDQEDWFESLDVISTTTTVPAGEVGGVMFLIKAMDVGQHNVTITARTSDTADKVVRNITVVPDGKQFPGTKNGQIVDNETQTVDFNYSIERVPGSEMAYLKLQVGKEAVVIDGAEQYIQFVSGCGEQSMSTLAIDILAFNMVQTSNGTTEQLFEFENMVSRGIQHELTFLLPAKNGQGRGIVWFPTDQDVHAWLTSWGLITFQDAVDAGFDLDERIFEDMQKWIVSQQDSDGSFSFPEWGLYETTNPILQSKKVASTAYITRALLYSGYDAGSEAVQTAVDYIEGEIDDVWDDPYALALALIVLDDAGGSQSTRTHIAQRLAELAIEEDGQVHWESETNMIGDGGGPRLMFGFGGGSSRITETTGYAIMALHGNAQYNDLVKKGVYYLMDHRTEMGFFSTQDTIVAFQAIAQCGTNNINKLKIALEFNGIDLGEFIFDKKNMDVTEYVDLTPYLEEENKLVLDSQGSGTLMYQVYTEEWIGWENLTLPESQGLFLDVRYDSTHVHVNDMINATLTMRYEGFSPFLRMVLVELRAPVGFEFYEPDLQDMMADGWISNYELNDREALLYITEVQNGSKMSLEYRLLAREPIRATLQGVRAYDMYEPVFKDELEPVEMVVV